MFTQSSFLFLPKKSPIAQTIGTQLYSVSKMTQIIEFSLAEENYLEYLRLLRSHGYHVAKSYATLVTSEDYKNRQPLACARFGRAKCKNQI